MSKNKITKENIIINLVGSSKIEVIQAMSEQLYKNGKITDMKVFLDDVEDREMHMTTGIGNGLAIPHGKSNAVSESTVVVAKLETPVDWNSLDGSLVDFVFLLAIKNEERGDEHLRILAELSGKLMDDSFVEKIKKATTQEELYEALKF
jgi:PTS system fructose-specific IIA component